MEKVIYEIKKDKSHGMISNIRHDLKYGFIRSDEGKDVYFRSSAVLEDFESLRAGHNVFFYEMTSPDRTNGIGITLDKESK